MPSGGEGLEQLVPDVVAARADARPDGGDQPPGWHRPLCSHGADGGAGDVGRGAAPAGVHGADGAGDLVGQQDRHAVGGDDCHSSSRHNGHQGVGRRRLRARDRSVHDVDGRAVDLAGPVHRVGGAGHERCRLRPPRAVVAR